MSDDARWAIETRYGSAQEHHGASFPAGATAHAWDLRVTRPALVLGGRQSISDKSRSVAEAAGVEVTSRRSGGGAVWIDPDTAVWIDFFIPTGHNWFDSDLTATFLRVGELWLTALFLCGIEGSVYAGRPDASDDLANRACFGGLGWGEITVNGSKVVGLSQRRTRDGARVQCLADISGNSARVGDYLDLTAAESSVLSARCGVPVSSEAAIAARLRAVLLDQVRLEPHSG